MRPYVFLLLALLVTGAVQSPARAAVVVPVTATAEPDPAKVKAAVDEFNSLSRKEKRGRIKEVKKELRAFRAAQKAGKEADTDTVLLVILAILLPPLAVYLYEGEINNRFWISLILTLLGWLPGIIYALVLILGQH
ncbi:MAG: YqaE/Pmp3 family membrane protein [Sphingobacteriales bacterium]|nr:YqaE/Pmp3 family membrane protein [Sphingobacteriales bacterium]